MTVKPSSAQRLLTIIGLCTALSAFADNDIILKEPFSIESTRDGVVTSIKLDLSPIEQHANDFAFDWNQFPTLATNKEKITEAEKFIATVQNITELTPKDQQALGKLLYTLGTYYTHVARSPDLAIARLTLANTLLTNTDDKAWNDNHLAYAYEQKYAESDQAEYKEKALFYTNKVISELYPRTKNKAVAFAYSIKGLVQVNSDDFATAETSFKTALAIYSATPNSQDDLYMRTKNRLANALIGQSGHDKEAIALLQQVKHYWSAKGNLHQDPYAARNLISLGEAYLKIGNAKAANNELKTAIAIYKNFYGNNSPLLIKPYELLAESYQMLGKPKQAASYEQKASYLDKA